MTTAHVDPQPTSSDTHTRSALPRGQNMFKDVHVLRDERDPHRPVPGYTYSRVDPSVAEGKRPSSYDFDDAQVYGGPQKCTLHPSRSSAGRPMHPCVLGQTRPRTAGFSPGHIRSLCTWPQLGCVQPQHIVDSLACTVSRASSPTSLAAAERLLLQQQPRYAQGGSAHPPRAGLSPYQPLHLMRLKLRLYFLLTLSSGPTPPLSGARRRRWAGCRRASTRPR